MGEVGPKFFGFFVRYEKWEDTGVFLHSGMQLASLIEDVIGKANFTLIDSDDKFLEFQISGASYTIHAKRANDTTKAAKAIENFASLRKFEITPLLGSGPQTLFGR